MPREPKGRTGPRPLGWPNYKAFAKPRGASLEADGRGETLFREKCASTLKRFKEGKIRGLESVEAVIIDDAARKGVAGLTVAQAREAPIERHLQVDNLGDFLKLKIPPKELILEPWLPAQGICMLFAYRGVGKTFVALGAAIVIWWIN